MKSGFEFLTNTLETRTRVWGKTVQELFRSALAGTASYMKTGSIVAKKKERKVVEAIRAEAVDIASLLVEFLSRVIAQSDASSTVFVDVAFDRFGENFLEGTLRGVAVENFDNIIKAVSYENIDIIKNSETGMYETTLVFDV